MEAIVRDIATGFAAVCSIYILWRLASILACRITAWFLAPSVIRQAESFCEAYDEG